MSQDIAGILQQILQVLETGPRTPYAGQASYRVQPNYGAMGITSQLGNAVGGSTGALFGQFAGMLMPAMGVNPDLLSKLSSNPFQNMYERQAGMAMTQSQMQLSSISGNPALGTTARMIAGAMGIDVSIFDRTTMPGFLGQQERSELGQLATRQAMARGMDFSTGGSGALFLEDYNKSVVARRQANPKIDGGAFVIGETKAMQAGLTMGSAEFARAASVYSGRVDQAMRVLGTSDAGAAGNFLDSVGGFGKNGDKLVDHLNTSLLRGQLGGVTALQTWAVGEGIQKQYGLGSSYAIASASLFGSGLAGAANGSGDTSQKFKENSSRIVADMVGQASSGSIGNILGAASMFGTERQKRMAARGTMEDYAQLQKELGSVVMSDDAGMFQEGDTRSVVNATSLQWQGALGKSKYNQLRGSLAKLGVNKLRDIVARSADGKQSAFDVSQSVGGVSTKAAEQMALAQLVEMGDTSEVVKKAIDRQKEGQGEAGNTGETAGEVIKEIMKGIQEKGVPLVQGLTDALTKLVANLGHLPQAVVAAAETAASAKAAGK